MTDIIYPPSTNWYLSQVVDISKKGKFCYGARLNIVLFDVIKSEDGTVDFCNFDMMSSCHKEKITAIRINDSCHTIPGNLVTSSEDGTVKLWDIHTKSEVHHYKHQENRKPLCLDWSTVDPNLVVSADDSGNFVVWLLGQNSIRNVKYFGTKCGVTTLACSLSSRDIIAAGYKDGLISIINISQKTHLIQKLRGHDQDLTCLMWCPFNDEGESILASGAWDRKINVWDTKKATSTTYKLPHFKSFNSRSSKESGKPRTFTVFTWLDREHLLCNGAFKDLLEINLADEAKDQQHRSICDKQYGHYRPIFTMTLFGNVVLTTSQDRFLLFWDIKSERVIKSLPSLGGIPYTLDVSPVDPGRLALGVGDSMIRVWNMNSEFKYETKTLWQGIRSKISVLSWHPEKDNELAFATAEGRIGIYNVFSLKPPAICKTSHKKMVYGLCWGKPTYQADVNGVEHKFSLYSCGDGVVFQHNPQQLGTAAQDIEEIISASNNQDSDRSSSFHTDISWKFNTDILAIGNEDGSVGIYKAPHLLCLAVIKVHAKMILNMKWHPSHTKTFNVLPKKSSNEETTSVIANGIEKLDITNGDVECSTNDHNSCANGDSLSSESPNLDENSVESSRKWWLATCSNDKTILINDLTEVIENNDHTRVEEITKPFKELNGHLMRVLDLCWSPHGDGRICSVSYDGNAQVWNAIKGEPLANFTSLDGRFYSCFWSSVYPNHILAAGEDQIVYMFDIHSASRKSPKLNKRKKTVKPSKGVAEVVQDDEEESKVNKSPSKSKTESTDEEITESGQAVTKDFKKIRKRPQKYFPVSAAKSKLTPYEEFKVLVEGEIDEEKSFDHEDCQHLNIFKDQKATVSLLNSEIIELIKQGNWDQAGHISMWTGDLKHVLKEAIANSHLTDNLVAMAPVVSYKFWDEVCMLYVNQLKASENYLKAAHYLLIRHKVMEAIDLLVQKHYFKEALCIARSRLPDDDAKISQIIINWASRAVYDGNPMLGAKCYATVGEYQEAIKAITLKRTPESFKVAAYLAQIIHDKKNTDTENTSTDQESDMNGISLTAEEYILKSLEEACTQEDFSFCHQILKNNPRFSWFSHLLSCHENLVSCNDLVKNGKASQLEDGVFLKCIWNSWGSEGRKRECLSRVHEMIKKHFSKDQYVKASKEFIFKLAVELTCYLTAPNLNEACSHLEIIFDFANHSTHFNILKSFFLILLPQKTADLSPITHPLFKEPFTDEFKEKLSTVFTKINDGNDIKVNVTEQNGVSEMGTKNPIIAKNLPSKKLSALEEVYESFSEEEYFSDSSEFDSDITTTDITKSSYSQIPENSEPSQGIDLPDFLASDTEAEISKVGFSRKILKGKRRSYGKLTPSNGIINGSSGDAQNGIVQVNGTLHD